MKIHFTKTKVTAGGQDPHADLLIEPTPLKGSHQLVPTDSQYAWLRIVGDKRWCESFRYALVSSWKSRVLSVGEGEKKEKNLPEINSIGDVIYKRWNCRRGHQILTRTRLTAEKFCKGESNLTFTADDERNFRSEAKSRSLILSDMCQTCLKNTDTSKIREWITRLWVIFAVGIDNDPTGTKVLSYDVRKKVHDTVIDQEDAVVIRAALFYFFVPTLPFEYCQKIAEEDYRKEPLPPLEKDSNFDGSITKATPSQKMFALIVMDVLGSLLDTLTEIEVAKVLKAFKPAIVDAHDRISKGVKGGIKERLAGEGQESSDALFYKGDGIHINHLDKYGNRKKQNKFV
ncbi:hypothetical protein, conserved [Angomonas deanei]|uniref:Uncharacterized protein n=1 Tax=Angomonas deanei TaxID=59799 RepID=A0A7G2CKQ9_9TRYP|nr:hypothetical protein, conserved [Angomonas deanei]